MQTKVHANNGLKRLVRRCRAEFQRSENTDFYAKEDFQAAQHTHIMDEILMYLTVSFVTALKLTLMVISSCWIWMIYPRLSVFQR